MFALTTGPSGFQLSCLLLSEIAAQGPIDLPSAKYLAAFGRHSRNLANCSKYTRQQSFCSVILQMGDDGEKQLVKRSHDSYDSSCRRTGSQGRRTGFRRALPLTPNRQGSTGLALSAHQLWRRRCRDLSSSAGRRGQRRRNCPATPSLQRFPSGGAAIGICTTIVVFNIAKARHVPWVRGPTLVSTIRQSRLCLCPFPCPARLVIACIRTLGRANPNQGSNSVSRKNLVGLAPGQRSPQRQQRAGFDDIERPRICSHIGVMQDEVFERREPL